MRLEDGVQHVDDVPHADVGGPLRRLAEGFPELAAHLFPVSFSAWQSEDSGVQRLYAVHQLLSAGLCRHDKASEAVGACCGMMSIAGRKSCSTAMHAQSLQLEMGRGSMSVKTLS